MQFRNHTRRQAASLLGALAAATALASPALAMRPDDRAGIRGVDAAAPAAAAQPDALMRYAVGHGLTSHQPYQYSWGAGDARLVSSKSYTQIRQTDPRAAGPVAGLRPDNRAGVRGVGQPEPAIATLHRYASEPTTPRVGEGFSLGQPKPIAVAGSKGVRFGVPNPVVVGRVQAATGALGARPDNRAGILGEPTPTVAQQSSSAGNGFDWADYGIGMGGGIGVAALLLGMALALRHRGQHKVALKSA